MTTEGGRTERDDAATWLREYLADKGGAAPFRDIVAAAKAYDIAERTLRRARERIGATVERKGYQGGAFWTLDPTRPHSGQSGQPARTHAPPGRDGRDESCDGRVDNVRPLPGRGA